MTRPAIHPGEMLKEEFMAPYGLSARKLAQMLDVPPNRITELVNGERGMTADTALRLEKLFGMPAYMWAGFQLDHDILKARAENNYSKIVPFDGTSHAA